MASLSQCVITFIKNILCANPILKSTFKTFLNSQILLAQEQISLISAQILRLDILNSFAQLEIQTLKTVQNQIQADLNVVFGPMSGYASCPEIGQILAQAQSGSTAKALAALQNLIYTYNRRQYVANALTAEQKQLQNYVQTAQNILNNIDNVCANS
jgi:predicted sugar kinase